MTCKIKTPARINIYSNTGDANEGGFTTISAIFSIYAHALIKENDTIILEQLTETENGFLITQRVEHNFDENPFPFSENFDLVKAGINR